MQVLPTLLKAALQLQREWVQRGLSALGAQGKGRTGVPGTLWVGDVAGTVSLGPRHQS